MGHLEAERLTSRPHTSPAGHRATHSGVVPGLTFYTGAEWTTALVLGATDGVHVRQHLADTGDPAHSAVDRCSLQLIAAIWRARSTATSSVVHHRLTELACLPALQILLVFRILRGRVRLGEI